MENRRNHHFLYFTKRERNGILIVVLINIIIYFSPEIYDYVRPQSNEIDPKAIADLKRLKFLEDSVFYQNDSDVYSHQNANESKKIVYKNFDPNSLSDEDWSAMGIKQKTIETIKKYLAKGGRFYKPEDLKKIWGIPTQKCDELIPFVKINSSFQSVSTTSKNFKKQKSDYKKITIEINSADSLLIESLQGIGPALTHRIIAYRSKLGGYYEVEQLKEVWGLQDSVYQKIKDRIVVNPINIRKIDINTINFDQLKIHPYFGYKIARAIINFRNQHGNFKSLEDIQKIILIDDNLFNKIKHYLVIS